MNSMLIWLVVAALVWFLVIPFVKTVIRVFGKFHRNPKANPLEQGQLRGLSIGALHGEQITAYVDSLETGLSRRRLSKMLETWWSIEEREDAVSVLNWLLEEGHREYYPVVLALIRSEEEAHTSILGSISEEERPEVFAFYKTLKADMAELEAGIGVTDADYDRGILGWDISRIVLLARTCFDCGYIEEEEAWNLIGIADGLARSEFQSWEELRNSVLIGRTMWGGYEDSLNQVYISEDLLGKDESPWKRIPFLE